jgi:hypothetical protein
MTELAGDQISNAFWYSDSGPHDTLRSSAAARTRRDTDLHRLRDHRPAAAAFTRFTEASTGLASYAQGQ